MNNHYNLMEIKKEDLPKCSQGEHSWRTLIKPEGYNSGWYEDVCVKCGIFISYDTSD